MMSFGDLPIPRRALARDIGQFLREPSTKPIHVHGPEGYGKHRLAQQLAVELESTGRPVAAVSLHDADGQSELEIINHRLLGALAEDLGQAVAPEINGRTGARVGRETYHALDAMAASVPGRPVFIIEGAEWLWSIDQFSGGLFERYGEDAQARHFDLVTLSAFSAQTLGLRNFAEERALLPLPAKGTVPNPFASSERDSNDDTGHLIEIREWIERRRSEAEPGKALAVVTTDDMMPIVSDCIAEWGGHPGLSIAAIDLLLRECEANDAAAMPAPRMIFQRQLASWLADQDTFIARLFPQLSAPETLPEQLCSDMIEGLGLFLLEGSGVKTSTVSPDMAETWFGLGLQQRGGPVERREAGFPQMRELWVTDKWLEARLDALKTRARSAGERRKKRDQGSDEDLPTVEAEVRRFFCNEEEGDGSQRSRCRLLDLETEVIKQGVQYKLILQREVPTDDNVSEAGSRARRNRRSRKPALTRETLHVFRNLTPLGERLWSQHNAMLKRLSALGNPALPQVYYGGRIDNQGEGDSDQRSMGYLLLRDLGPPLSSKFRDIQRSLTQPWSGEDETRPVAAATSAAELAEALSLLHSKGYAHRRISLDTIRVSSADDQVQLALSGFEFALILDMLSLNAPTGVDGTQATDSTSLQHLPFASLDRLRVIAEGVDSHFGVVTWAEADVHAMCALLAYLFTGGLKERELEELDRKIPRQILDADDREQACQDLSRDICAMLLDDEKWLAAKNNHHRAYRIFLDEMKQVVAEGLSEPGARQPVSIDDISRRISYQLDRYRRALATDRTRKFALYYDARHMGPNLEKLGFIVDSTTPTGRAEVKRKLEEWLDAASEIRYREDGFFGRGGDASAAAKKAAKYMVISDQVVIFASFHNDYATRKFDYRLLRLAFTVRRSEVHLTKLDETDQTPFPASFELLSSDQLDEIAREEFSDWQNVLRPVESNNCGLGEVASASMHFHRQLLLGKEELKRFPVRMLRQGQHAYLSLDRAAYRKARRGNEFVNLVILGGLDDAVFFIDTVEAWREEMPAGSAKLQFVSRGNGRPDRFDIALEGIDTSQVTIADDERLTEYGTIEFSDLSGAARASSLQAKAIDKFLSKRSLFARFNSPRNEAPVVMRAPVEYGNKYGDDTVSVIQNIKSGLPITALQGPPGSGKSTTIALLISDMLREDETTRFLITAQSHAAVDVTLEKVVSVTGGTPENEFSNQVPDAIRLLPVRNSDRVSQHVRENHAIKAVVEQKLADIRRAAEREPTNLETEEMRDAYRALKEAGKRSAFEIWNRLERHAPLVFGTTAASATAAQMVSRGDEFDVVIVDEAAKAYGIDLVQPLSIARQVVLVGDHKQLSPFDYQGVKQSFETAREHYANMDLGSGVPEEVAIICDSENFDDALSWLTPFERFFEKAESSGSAARSASPKSAIPVAQMLSTQHRSLAPIGELVSRTFYKHKVRTAAALKQDDYRDKVPWQPNIDGKDRAPVIIWIDTSGLSASKYNCDFRQPGKLFNDGEIEIVQRVVEACDLGGLAAEGLVPEERFKVLSPYRQQVAKLEQALHSVNLDQGVRSSLDRIAQTIDSSQGAESAVVVVSMTRTGTIKLPRGNGDEAYQDAMRQSLGFLTDAARMNVMFSRAMRQLVIVGKFALFRSFDDLVQEWISEADRSEKKLQLDEDYGFWGRLLDQFSDNPDAEILRVNAQRILGLVD